MHSARRPLRTLRVVIALAGLASGHASAQMLMPGGPGTFDPFQAQASWVPGLHGAPALTEYRLRGAAPLSRTEVDSWTLGLYAARTHLGADLQLSPSGLPIPRDLWAVDANVGYSRRLGAGRTLGFTIGLGALSDKPFHSLHEAGLNASATYLVPSASGDAWLFGLNFSSDRPALNYIPLPILGYFWRSPERGLDGALGFPFVQVRWTPAPAWELLLRAIVPTKITAEVGLRPVRAIRLSTGFDWDQQLWALAGRADSSTRLFYDSKRAAAAIEFPLFRPLALQVSGGYVFDRTFFEGTSVFNRGDRAALDASWFAAVALKMLRDAPRAGSPGAPPGGPAR